MEANVLPFRKCQFQDRPCEFQQDEAKIMWTVNRRDLKALLRNNFNGFVDTV